MWISKKKIMKLEKRLSIAEQKIARLDKEMHPTFEEMRDAFERVIQFHLKNPTYPRNGNAQSVTKQ